VVVGLYFVGKDTLANSESGACRPGLFSMNFDSLDVFDFPFTGGLDKLWSTGNDAIVDEMNGVIGDSSASPVSSSGSEERPGSCEVNYQLLPRYQQGDEPLTSIFSDDFPLLDVVLGDDSLQMNNQPQRQQCLIPKPQSSDHDKVLSVKEEISLTDVEKSRRNAIAAKKNRERKKAQMAALEKEVENLSEENSKYKKRCSTLENAVLTLNKEVEYYKRVLANDSVLARLLENIPNVQGVRLSSSLGKRPNSSSSSMSSKMPKLNGSTSGGVCLHVSKDSVSLELCAHCSSLAGASSTSE